MRKTAIFILLCIILLASGCPRALKTKPSTNLENNQLVTQVNNYLANRQMAYYCAMTGRYVNLNYNDFSFNKTYSCGNQRNAAGAIVTEDHKKLAKAIRDETIEYGIMAINSVYNDFVDDINSGRATTNFIADVIDLGTSAAIGITNGERAIQVLGVALTAFRGGRKSADLNFFREQSTPILINKMDDSRATLYGSIILKKKKPVDEYPMTEAIRDIVDYYNAGTLVRAFSQLSKETGASALEAEKKVLQLKEINPKDIVAIPPDVLQAAPIFFEYRNKADNIFRTGTDAQKKDATEKLKLIYMDIVKGDDLKPKVVAFKTANPNLAPAMTKLEDNTDTSVPGETILLILRGIYKSFDDTADAKLIKEFVEYFKKHPLAQ